MDMPDIIIVGSCNMDLISYVENFPKPGETVEGSSFSIGFGGKGANQCVAAAKLGASTAMVAKVGDDAFGKDYLDNFKLFNINTSYVKVAKGVATGVAPIMVNAQGENCVVIASGANLCLGEDDVNEAESWIKNSKILVCQREVAQDATKRALALAQKHGVKTIFNAAPAHSNMDDPFFRLSDVFCVNESEAEIIVGFALNSEKEMVRASEALIEKGCRDVIITLGKHGALLSSQGDHTFIKAPAVEAIDTTGAGDAFVGTLAYFLATKPHISFSSIVERSCKVATISTQKKGTQSSYPTYNDLDKCIFD